jgi:asparagine synthase (glutamine-hydrolysing)
MCGIAGFLASDGLEGRGGEVLEAMTAVLSHRGPDDSGTWLDAEGGMALGHRRLSVLDLSPHGAQPMRSASGRFVISYNGEVYNFAGLRAELEASPAPRIAWRGHSDTEVVLAAFERWGVEQALQKFVGMFAFALWDRRERELTLVRDRLGEKPLYYARLGQGFAFASELKALKRHPDWRGEIDRDALALLLRHGYIPAPHSIFKGVHKLPAGTLLRVGAVHAQAALEPKRYWSAKEVAEAGTRHPLELSERDAVTQLEALLTGAVAQQMIADVPLGAFLSGGVDSSTVVALMQKQSAARVKTFAIGFAEEQYDEAGHARAVARYLGTDHHELYVTPRESMAVIPRLASVYDEPFADPSQIPTCLVAALAREQVTVSLSGDGGDELFGGYQRYLSGRMIWRGLGWLPVALRRGLAGAIRLIPPSGWDALLRPLPAALPGGLRLAPAGDKLHKLAEIVAAESPDALYAGLVSQWTHASAAVLAAREPSTSLTDPACRAVLPDFTHRMMYMDSVSYLPDDILVKVDRAGMAVSLETRMPLLDHRVVEFAWRLPPAMKMRGRTGKWALRQVLHRHVPRELVERPKMGFAVPLDAWLRGPLRGWAEELLSESRLRTEGFFDVARIREKWSEHLHGRRNWQQGLWSVLMFQAWLQEQARR